MTNGVITAAFMLLFKVKLTFFTKIDIYIFFLKYRRFDNLHKYTKKFLVILLVICVYKCRSDCCQENFIVLVFLSRNSHQYQ